MSKLLAEMSVVKRLLNKIIDIQTTSKALNIDTFNHIFHLLCVVENSFTNHVQFIKRVSYWNHAYLTPVLNSIVGLNSRVRVRIFN